MKPRTYELENLIVTERTLITMIAHNRARLRNWPASHVDPAQNYLNFQLRELRRIREMIAKIRINQIISEFNRE